MSLFHFNTKPGPGIEKDTPPKKGIFRWWEIFTRDFNAMLLSNGLLLLCALPALACVAMFVASCNAGAPWLLPLVANLLAAVVLGPALAACHRLTLNMCRDEPFFTWHEFKKSFKQNFKQGAISMVILTLIADIIMLNLYLMTVVEDYGGLQLGLLVLCIYIWLSLLNTIFHQIAMMELPLKTIWKNGFLLVLVSGWRGVLMVLFDLTFIVLFVMYGMVIAPVLLFGLPMWVVMTGDLIFWPRFKQIFIDRDIQKPRRRSAAKEWQEAAAAAAAEKEKNRVPTADEEWAKAMLADMEDLEEETNISGEE